MVKGAAAVVQIVFAFFVIAGRRITLRLQRQHLRACDVCRLHESGAEAGVSIILNLFNSTGGWGNGACGGNRHASAVLLRFEAVLQTSPWVNTRTSPSAPAYTCTNTARMACGCVLVLRPLAALREQYRKTVVWGHARIVNHATTLAAGSRDALTQACLF